MKFIFHSKYSEYSDLNKSIFQSKPFQSISHKMMNNCNSSILNQQEHSIDLIMATLLSLPVQLIQLQLDEAIKDSIIDKAELVCNIIWGGRCDEYQSVGNKIND